MIDSLTPEVQDIATLVVLLLPGFVFLSTFEAVNIASAKNRSTWEWTMRSLLLSLPMFAMFSGIYDEFDWPSNPTDPEFYFGLFGGAFLGGYVVGSVTRTTIARATTKFLGISEPRRTWVDVVGKPDSYLIVHLKDGSVIYGYPSSFTDDPRQEVREIFLRQPARLRREDDTDPGEWEDFPQTEGVLVESAQINFIQLVGPRGETEEQGKN